LTLVAEYALRDLNKPIGVSHYELSSTLLKERKTSLPTLSEVEKVFSKKTSEENHQY